MATRIRIQHNGRQLGPYSLEEARRMVLAGEIPSGSHAEIDDCGEWRPLNQLADFVGGPRVAPATPSSAGAVVPAAEPVRPSEERTLWSGSPSQILNFRLFAGWLLVLGLVGAGLFLADKFPAWQERVTRPQAMIGFGALVLVGFLHCVASALRLRSTHYLVTTQRVRITRGLLGKKIEEIELFRVKDTTASQNFFRRIMGVGDIDIESGDANNPHLHLSAVPRAMELRESIRHEVLALRQRFGVRELDVM